MSEQEEPLTRILSSVSPEERWWVEHRAWLESSGYLLRPRFQPGWEPSWHDPKVELLDAEDQYPVWHPDVLDATRLSDGVSVMLKRVDRRQHPDEVEITALLSSPPLSSDPRNHCIPLFDVLEVPDNASMRIMVLPLLRRCADPRFDTVGEVVDCLQQVLEFLHEKKITHRDFHLMNIMMNADPLYTVPFHPVSKNRRRDWNGYVRPSYTRTERPVQYHIIDFGLSIKYDSVDPPPMEIPVLGGDKSLPEFVGDDPAVPFSGLSKPYNPFPADVYCVGSWIRGEFLVGNIRSRLLGLDFLWPLVNEMTEKDPQKRPTMDQVMSHYKDIVSSLSSWKLRSRVAKARDNSLHSLYLSVTHWARRVRFVASKRPAIPTSASRNESLILRGTRTSSAADLSDAVRAAAFNSVVLTPLYSHLATDLFTLAHPDFGCTTSASERFEQRLRAPPRTSSMIWDSERWWINHRPWLESCGYMLRPRYQPGWEPSWHSEKDKNGWFRAEDSVPMGYPFLMDATRIYDGVVVMMKCVNISRHPTEGELTTMLSSPPLTSEARNHCIPIYDVLQDPDDDKYQLMVLPLLRRYASPRFDTIGEAVECFHQIIQCHLVFMLVQNTECLRRDIHRLNIMMDASPLYTTPYHPIDQTRQRDFKGLATASYTRTQHPVRYYIIDFGLSVRYDTLDPVEIPVLGGDKTVPEFKGDDPSKRYGGLSNLYNPFPTDVYCLGNWIREDFLEGTRNERSNEVLTSKRLGFEFLRPLVESMTQADPSKRPTMDEVADRFESLAASLSSWKLRSRVAKENDNPFYSMYLSTTHCSERLSGRWRDYFSGSLTRGNRPVNSRPT
ncbi:hypothetical protein GGF50DRAFT_129666 [Schizophyllum commune]